MKFSKKFLASLMEYFSQYGLIDIAYLIYDKNSNNSRCFGFVEYVDQKDADHVNSITTHILDNKPIITKFQVLKKNKSSKQSDDEDDDLTSIADYTKSQYCHDQSDTKASLHDENLSSYNQNNYLSTELYDQNQPQQQYVYQEVPQNQYQQYGYVDNQNYCYDYSNQGADYYYYEDYSQNQQQQPTTYHAQSTQNLSTIEEPVYYIDQTMNNVDNTVGYYDENGYYQQPPCQYANYTPYEYGYEYAETPLNKTNSNKGDDLGSSWNSGNMSNNDFSGVVADLDNSLSGGFSQFLKQKAQLPDLNCESQKKACVKSLDS